METEPGRCDPGGTLAAVDAPLLATREHVAHGRTIPSFILPAPTPIESFYLRHEEKHYGANGQEKNKQRQRLLAMLEDDSLSY
jgi:hypothetical protein